MDQKTLLSHLAIIMDGNGRWAEEQGLPRSIGHKQGAKTLEEIIKYIAQNNVCDHLTLFCFSTENWKRPTKEVNHLFALMNKYLLKQSNSIQEKNINLNFIGNIAELPPQTKEIILNIVSKNPNKQKKPPYKSINFAINYGSKFEITNAFKTLLQKLIEKTKETSKNIDSENQISAVDLQKLTNQITFDTIKQHFLTADIPEPELLIRTGRHKRLSNFLLMQIAYTEICFIDTLWPDFTTTDLEKILKKNLLAQHNFGNVTKKLKTNKKISLTKNN